MKKPSFWKLLFPNHTKNITSFLQKLSEYESQLLVGKGDYDEISEWLSKELNDKEQVREYRKRVLPKLIPFLFLLIDSTKKRQESDPAFDEGELDMDLAIKIARFKCPMGVEAIAELMKIGHKEKSFHWVTILQYLCNDRESIEIIINKLKGRLPREDCGNCYLDTLNEICRNDDSFGPHPFSSPEGVVRLEYHLTSDDRDYAFSAASSLPFMPENVWKKLLPIAMVHPNKKVQIEACWAGTKLGNKDSLEKLIESAKDYRYGSMCVRYLKELGLADLIPEECQTHEFYALSEMSSWLEHPLEFGAIPTELSIVESRKLCWPSTKDEQQFTIVRYRYEKWNKDGSDEVGVGLVGSVTFCLFGLEGLNERTPEEIFAIHCAWEMELDDYANPEVGMAILRKHNPGFGDLSEKSENS